MSGSIERLHYWLVGRRIRAKACECAAAAIACRQAGEDPCPLLWSMTVFFETYILEGCEATRGDFGPKDPVKLKSAIEGNVA